MSQSWNYEEGVMRSITTRFLVALITFTIGILAASVWLFHPPRKSESRATQNLQPQSQNRSEEILRVLMPNDVWGDVTQLDRFDHTEEIRVLKEAQVEAKNERSVSIAFLLAALGNDYEANRKKLLDALKECSDRPYPKDGECTYFVADYLMELCQRGDFSLFKPLFNSSRKADGAFAESLGAFYSAMLYEHPKQFLEFLSPYPKNKQRALCSSAGVEDGGGMAEERFQNIRKSLNDVSDNSFRRVARTCLLGLERGYKQAMENNKSVKAN
jgi:hypothetical protein